MNQFELHVAADQPGWRGFEVTVHSEGERSLTYSFGEHEGVRTPAEAVQRTFAQEHDADRATDGATIVIEIREIRIQVSAEINPN